MITEKTYKPMNGWFPLFVTIGMVVAGPLYQDAEGDDKWAESGASAITGPLDPGISDEDLDGARRLGQRIANLAKKMAPR